MDRIPEAEIMDIPERAQAYADADFASVNAAFVHRLLERAGTRAHCRALDLGTGPGDIPMLLAEYAPGWRITGLDASLPMLRLAQSRRAHAKVGFVLSDAKRTPFGDNTFDVVFSNSILHHVETPAAFWSEIARVVAPGGLVFVRDLLRPESPDAAARIVEANSGDEHPLLKEDFYNSLLAAYTVEEVESQARAAGLSSARAEQITDRHLDLFT